MKTIRGEKMRFEYYVIGAVALLVVVAGVAMLPDFVRYMKIRSM
jgi:bacteriorhodopsin